MRDALNSNPVVQAAVLGALLIGAALFLLSSSGGGEEEESTGTEATVSIAGTEASGSATGATPGEAVEGALDAAVAEAGTAEVPPAPLAAALDAPPLPPRVTSAYEANQTLVLLFVRDGGIDDRLVELAAAGVAGFRDVALFVVSARKISRYASITEGVGVDRVPALVVVTPKRLKQTVPTASVSYGFQSPQSVVQAVIDAGYKGPTLDYHP